MPQNIVEAIKGELSLRVLGAPYGVDRQGQEFHYGTDFGDLPIVPAIYWHGWGQDDGERIGWAHKAERDAQGQWYRVVLDTSKATAQKVYEAAVKGMARASSDAIAHLVRPKGILGKAGKVDRWVIGALSLMDEATYQSAVNPRAIALPALKAYYEAMLTEEEYESGEAVKAGAALAKRNRERIIEIKKQLDELLNEFPTEPSDTPLQDAGTKLFESMPVKSEPAQEVNIKMAKKLDVEAPEEEAEDKAQGVVEDSPEDKKKDKAAGKKEATKAEVDFDALINDAADRAASKAIEALPKQEEKPAVKSYSAEEVVEIAQKAAEKAAVKATDEAVKAAQRMQFPTVVKKEEDYADPLPLTWAVKAAHQTGGSIVFNFNSKGKGLEFDGTGDAVKAFKAMATTASAAIGEHFIPRVQTDMVVANLYEKVVTRSFPGVNVYPMPGLVCDAPTIGAFSAGWTAENATAAAAGDAATGRKTLTAKNLTALATISNQLLADTSPAIERYIREGLASAMGEVHDTGALYGTNANNQPLGITSTANVTSTAISTDDVYTAILKAIGRMAANKLPVTPSNVAVIMRPEVLVKALTSRVGSSGDFIASNSQNTNSTFVGARLEDRVSARLGYQVFSTTTVPAATGTVTSSILVLYAPDFVIGDRQELEIAASNVAGNAFAYNQTLIRAIMRVDFLLMRAAALEIITGVAH